MTLNYISFYNCVKKNLFYHRFSSVMITRMMLNLRDPTFIPVSDRNVSEDTTYPDLTYVESYYPTQLSDVRGGFTESESRGGDEAWDLDLHRPSGKHLVFFFPLTFL